MVKNMKLQQGMSFWALIWVAALSICLVVVLVRSVPVFLNNHKIDNALNALLEEPDVHKASRANLLQKLQTKLYIDYADKYVDLNKAFRVRKIKNGRSLSIDYEVVVSLVGNAYLLFDFKNKVDVVKRSNG